MSDQTGKILDLARSVPTELLAEWDTQWLEDGTPCGHAMAPVGLYIHNMVDEIERLTAELGHFRANEQNCQHDFGSKHSPFNFCRKCKMELI